MGTVKTIVSASKYDVFNGITSMLSVIPGGYKIYSRKGAKYSQFEYRPATFAITNHGENGTADIVLMASKMSNPYNVGIVTRLHLDKCPVKLLILEDLYFPQLISLKLCRNLFGCLMQVPYPFQSTTGVFYARQHKQIFKFLERNLISSVTPELDPAIKEML